MRVSHFTLLIIPRHNKESLLSDYIIELEIYEGSGGQLRTDGTQPDFANEGICAWMYGSFQVGQKFRYPKILGNCVRGWWTV
jgi:hypothetical protein